MLITSVWVSTGEQLLIKLKSLGIKKDNKGQVEKPKIKKLEIEL